MLFRDIVSLLICFFRVSVAEDPKDVRTCIFEIESRSSGIYQSMKLTWTGFAVTLRAFFAGFCALFAFSITGYAQSAPSPSPSAQPDFERETRSEELQESAAVEATFSRDGSHVYAIDIETPHLLDIDFQKNVFSIVDLGASIDNKSIISVGTGKSGDLLVATARAAWSCNPARKACKKLCSAPEGVQFAAIACDPKSGGILFSTQTDFDDPAQSNDNAGPPAMFLAAGAKEPKPVLSRRVGFLDGITFSSDGGLFFGVRGDLWMGSIGPQEDEETPWLLDAVRCAPLATFETTMATPTQVGVFSVAVAKQMLYVHLHRMFGTGEGNVVRLPRPDNAPEADDDVRARMRLYSKETGAVEVLVDNGTLSYLCASADGRRVFFTSGVLGKDHEETKAYLIENNGKPREIKLKLPE